MARLAQILTESRKQYNSTEVIRSLEIIASDEPDRKAKKFYELLASRISQSYPSSVNLYTIENVIAREPAVRKLWNRDDWEYVRDAIFV